MYQQIPWFKRYIGLWCCRFQSEQSFLFHAPFGSTRFRKATATTTIRDFDRIIEGKVYILGQQDLSAFYLLCFTGLNWFMGCLGRSTCIVHSSSAQTSHKGIKCTKAKEQLRPYCPNIYTVIEGMQAKRAKSQGQVGPNVRAAVAVSRWP